VYAAANVHVPDNVARRRLLGGFGANAPSEKAQWNRRSQKNSALNVNLQARNQGIGAGGRPPPRPSAKGARGPLSFADEIIRIKACNKIKIVSSRLTRSLRLYCMMRGDACGGPKYGIKFFD